MKRRNTVAIKTQVLFHRAGVWGTSTHPHNSELNNRCLSGWHHKNCTKSFHSSGFSPLAIMHVYSRIELGKDALFLHLQKQISPWKGSIVFKIVILAVYLSILKRSIWNSILMGLVPCAREKCCKEEPGKPLGPYFCFSQMI